MRNFLALLFIAWCTSSCSFADKAKIPPVESDQSILSASQVRVLEAVEQNDAATLKNLLATLSGQDLDFSKLEETPLSIALRLNLSDVSQILLRSKVNSGQLGNYESELISKTLINFEAGTPESLNNSEKIVTQYYLESVGEIEKLIAAEKYLDAKSLSILAKTNCPFLVTTLVLRSTAVEESEANKLLSFLNILDCRPAKKEFRLLYEYQLKKQFKTLFKSPWILKYFFRDPTLDPMWDIDKSGFYISPQLLLRITFSLENAKAFSEIDITETPLYMGEGQESDLLLRKLGHSPQAFELIDAREGRPFLTYLFFHKWESDSNETFFKKVITYLNGEKPQSAEKSFWDGDMKPETSIEIERGFYENPE